MPDKGKELLEGAYALATPDDNISYYREFADHYDDHFVKELGYNLPHVVAKAFLRTGSPSDTPIADLGCGTGIVAQCLPKEFTIDGLDISPDMLAVAGAKKRYRDLYQTDITQGVSTLPNNYGAVLSSGTFTHGHLGPGALKTSLGLGKAGCLFVLSINKAHYSSHGFENLLDTLSATNAISDLLLEEAPIYTEHGHDHSGDIALICSFRLC